MKKVFSLMLLLATMLTFTACSSDDDEPENPNEKLWGTWVYEKSTTNESTGIVISIESVWIFRTNNTYEWTMQTKLDGEVFQSKELFSGQYSLHGNTLSITYDNNQETDLNITVSGNSMTIVTDEGTSMTHYRK